MNKFPIIGCSMLVAVMLIFLYPVRSNAQTYDANLLKGIDLVYHVKFDSADAVFDDFIRKNQKDPSGYFFKVLVEWWRINLDRYDESFDEELFKRVDKAVDVSDERLDKNENDNYAMFFKGGAIGYRGLIRSIRESWLKAAEDGKESLNLLQKAYELNDRNKDAVFGVGIYNYFAEYVPENYPVLKPLMIIFPKGDKLKGLKQIQETAMNSQYARTEANFILLYLNQRYENNYNEGEKYSTLLRNEYPENPVFGRMYAANFVGMNKWNDALNEWKIIAERCDSNFTGYNQRLKREAHYYIALCLSKLGRLKEGEVNLAIANDLNHKLDKNDDTAFGVYTNMMLGMLKDENGDHSSAIEYYNKVIAMKEFGNSKVDAERFKKSGYK
ncbi:hypothetical protein BH10BAC5_BH10BAC5_24560 [soil metagenome]